MKLLSYRADRKSQIKIYKGNNSVNSIKIVRRYRILVFSGCLTILYISTKFTIVKLQNGHFFKLKITKGHNFVKNGRWSCKLHNDRSL